jgi:hypothetical protein
VNDNAAGSVCPDWDRVVLHQSDEKLQNCLIVFILSSVLKVCLKDIIKNYTGKRYCMILSKISSRFSAPKNATKTWIL